jgi:competence protein ComEA
MKRVVPAMVTGLLAGLILVASGEGAALAATGAARPAHGPAAHKSAPAHRVNLNTATEAQLASLPGIHKAEARKIAAGRPFKSPADLVSKKILSKSAFAKIKNRVQA